MTGAAEIGNEQQVVAGILLRRGRALFVHRSPRRAWYPDLWDLPGGHVEAGEGPAAAVRRELEEELGVVVEVGGVRLTRMRGPDFCMDVWLLDGWRGDPVNRMPQEHDALA